MTQLDDALYCPILRTRDAELKGFGHVSSVALKKLVPLFELTRSRRSKNNADGDVDKSIQKIIDCINDKEFIVDITSMESMHNTELSSLLDQENGFKKWVAFVRDRLPNQAIPVVHLTSPFDEAGFLSQVRALQRIRDIVLIRVANEFGEFAKLCNALIDLGDIKRIRIMLDAGFIDKDSYAAAESLMIGRLGMLDRGGMKQVIVSSSSFPSSVVAPGYGADSYGVFPLLEMNLSRSLRRKTSIEIRHGDYASIHPNEFSGTVTNWVPRVDVPLREQTFYYRYRRQDGGYVEAATRALSDPKYVKLLCWADENIEAAAAGNPEGRSPAHWIAVRVNRYIEGRFSY